MLLRPTAEYLSAMSTPRDPEEMCAEVMPQLSQQLTDQLLRVASEFLARVPALDALSAS
jgi:hypothetical protein